MLFSPALLVKSFWHVQQDKPCVNFENLGVGDVKHMGMGEKD